LRLQAASFTFLLEYLAQEEKLCSFDFWCVLTKGKT
jgi:hypothetical protein